MTSIHPAAAAIVTIAAGFKNPVMQSQAAFRVIMSAMAGPGRWLELTDELSAPVGLPLPAALTLLTLADFETPVWLPQTLLEGAAGAWLQFHCNCPLVTGPAEAAFGVIQAHDPSMPRLADFSAGDDRFPDRSATVLVICDDRSGGLPFELSGPGIEKSECISPAGIGQMLRSGVIENSQRYPLGIDLLLVDQSHICGLPRSTRIQGAA